MSQNLSSPTVAAARGMRLSRFRVFGTTAPVPIRGHAGRSMFTIVASLTAIIAGPLACTSTPERAEHDHTDASRLPADLPPGSVVGPWIDLIAVNDGAASLDGWIQHGGSALYRIEGDAIVGVTRPNQPNSFLCTARDFADFELTLEFKVDPRVNSGVQFRSNSRPEYENGRVHGCQYEIDPSPRAWTAGVYDEGRRGWIHNLERNPDARAAFRQNEWNTLRVVAIGDHIRTWINGVPATDFRDSTDATGFIALQVHGVGDRADPLEVRWRGIRCREITPQPDHARRAGNL